MRTRTWKVHIYILLQNIRLIITELEKQATLLKNISKAFLARFHILISLMFSQTMSLKKRIMIKYVISVPEHSLQRRIDALVSTLSVTARPRGYA